MAKPKLALIPAAQGSKLFSVLPSSGVGDFTFTRSGSATRINSQGLIETVGNGVSRLNYPMIDGKVVGCPSHLLEPQSTNLVQYSEDFSQSYWTKTNSSVVGGFISPDGTTNAFKLIENTGNATHQIQRNLGVISGNVTYSIFAKSSERDIIFINAYTGSTNVTFFDLTNGTVLTNASGNTAKIELLPNGYYRCSVERVANALVLFEVGVSKTDGVRVYQGDGTSGLYIWGAQLEQSSYPTSYIPNFGTALGVTRSAETATNSGDASTFNDSEGVLMAEISALADDGTNRRISISDGSTSDRIVLGYTASSNQLIVLVSSNSVSGVASIVNIDNSLQFNKIALKYKLNDFALWINGIEVLTDNSLNSPIGLNDLSFEGADNLNDFYGKTKQIQYYNSALTDSELEKISSWVSFEDMANGQQYSIK